jgi:oligopeptide transport system permease protein
VPRYIARRLAQVVVVFLGSTFLIFAMVFALPGDPIKALAGNHAVSPSVEQELRERYHLDEPLIQQYVQYMARVLHGDLGTSFQGRPVSTMITEDWPVTATLALSAWVLEVVFGVGLGLWAAVKVGSLVDRSSLVFSTAVIAVPIFVVGYVLQIVFGINLGWFPTSGVEAGWPTAYVLPAITLALFGVATVSRVTRASLRENLRSDAVRTAVAKGLPRRLIIGKHALRNSLIPVVTFVGVDLGLLMGGVVLVEGIYNLPGIGNELFRAIGTKDGPVVVGLSTLIVLLFLVINLVVDLVYALIDPRIRYA